MDGGWFVVGTRSGGSWQGVHGKRGKKKYWLIGLLTRSGGAQSWRAGSRSIIPGRGEPWCWQGAGGVQGARSITGRFVTSGGRAALGCAACTSAIAGRATAYQRQPWISSGCAAESFLLLFVDRTSESANKKNQKRPQLRHLTAPLFAKNTCLQK